MRRATILLTLGALLLVAIPIQAQPPDHAAGQGKNFVAPLSGGGEAEPVDTRARGLAKFQLSADGTELHYRLIVANIENVLMAHIHLEASSGPVVVWLYPFGGDAPDLIPGRFQGTLATGTITSAQLVGPLTEGSLSDLLEEMMEGNAFVNVHTLQHGPGEIAGQIR